MGFCQTSPFDCGFAQLEPEGNCRDEVFNIAQNLPSCLYDSIVSEAIQSRGVECIYIKRDLQNVDIVFGEDPRSKFTEWYKFTAYVESFDGWQGDQDLFTKFGFTINDEMTLSINPNLFMHQTDGLSAREGDLIYFPLANSLFELTWVEREDPWYAMGTLPIRKLKAQKFIYSGEEINLSTENIVDSVDGLFTIDEDDIERINNLDGRWDIMSNEGAEIEQVQTEVDKFFESGSVVPPGASISYKVNLNNFDI